MLRFKQKNLVPPGGKYFYTIPGTEKRYAHSTQNGLFLLLREYYFNNGFDLPEHLMDDVEHQMCLGLPESTCEGHTEDVRANAFTFDDVKMRTWDYNVDSSPAPMDLMGRIKECMACSQHIRGACGTCSGLKYATAHMLRGRHAPDEDSLRVCAIDGGFLPVKVYADRTSIPNIPDVVHGGCWAHYEVKNE